jgi:enamine deaminase RidA (YjgF/YER057c/UK114 family)
MKKLILALVAIAFVSMPADAQTGKRRRKQFKGDPPARTTVQVARLPRDARIEIEAVAVLK